MLIGWFVARRDIRRRLAALRSPVVKLADPRTAFAHVIDRDGAAGECVGHADACSAMMSARAQLSLATFSNVAPFFLRLHREGVVGSIDALRQINDIGMRCALATSNRDASGSAFSIIRHDIGKRA